jgi:hypothetical protein
MPRAWCLALIACVSKQCDFPMGLVCHLRDDRRVDLTHDFFTQWCVGKRAGLDALGLCGIAIVTMHFGRRNGMVLSLTVGVVLVCTYAYGFL